MNGVNNHDFPECLEFSVLHSVAASSCAIRFLEERYRDVELDLLGRRRMLQEFQKKVMDTFEEQFIFTASIGDMSDDDDQDIADLYRIYLETQQRYTGFDLVGLVPMDLSGSIGCILQPKPMRSPK